MDDGGEAALDHCLPSTISWPAGEAGMEGKKQLTPSQETKKKVIQKEFFFSFTCLPGGVSKKITMSHSSHTHPQQLIFLGRNGEARAAAMSIAKGKTPAKHTYLFTVQEKQMDKEGRERGKREKRQLVSILTENKQKNFNKHKKLMVEQKFLNANNILETEKWELTQTSWFRWL